MAWVWRQTQEPPGLCCLKAYPSRRLTCSRLGLGAAQRPLSFADFISIHMMCTVSCMLGRWQP